MTEHIKKTTIESFYDIKNYEDHMDISSLINSHNWCHVLSRLEKKPNEVQQTHRRFIPLIHALRIPNVPLNIIQTLLKLYPESCKVKDEIYKLLPIQWAIKFQSSKIINLLLNYYPEGVISKDDNGRTPLIYYLMINKSPSFEIIELMIKCNKKLLYMKDKQEMTPLHHTVNVLNWDIIQYILNLYPKALGEKDMAGLLPRNYVEKMSDNWYRLKGEEINIFGNDLLENDQ